MLGSMHATNMEMIDTTGYIGANTITPNKQRRRRRRQQRRSLGASGFNRHKPQRIGRFISAKSLQVDPFLCSPRAARHVEDVDGCSASFRAHIYSHHGIRCKFCCRPSDTCHLWHFIWPWSTTWALVLATLNIERGTVLLCCYCSGGGDGCCTLRCRAFLEACNFDIRVHAVYLRATQDVCISGGATV